MKQAVKKGGTSANFSYNLGNALFTKGVEMGKSQAIEEAVQAFSMALSMKPDDPDIRTNLGIALMEMGKPAEAIMQYQEVMRLEPGDGLTHYNCGNAFLTQGLHEQAIEQYSEAIILLPLHYDSHYNLSMALMKAGNFEEAIDAMENLLLWDVEHELGSEGEGESGELEVSGAGDAGGGSKRDNSIIYYNIGYMKGKLGLTEKAIEYLKASIKIDRSNAYAHLNLGNFLALAKDAEGSLAAYREACKISPKDPKILRNMAYVLIEQENVEEGVLWLEKLLEVAPNDSEITSYLEQCQEELKMSRKIKEDIEAGLKVVEKEPQNVGARANLAMAMKADGNLAGAIAQFEECLNVQPGHPQIESFLKECQDQLKTTQSQNNAEPGSIEEEKTISKTGRFSMFGGKKKGRAMGGGKKQGSQRKVGVAG